ARFSRDWSSDVCSSDLTAPRVTFSGGVRPRTLSTNGGTSSRDSGPPKPTKNTALFMSLTEQPPQIVCFDSFTHIERAELPETGADLVEAHLVDQLLELERVVGEQRHAPFPVVEAHGAGHALGHLPGIPAPGPTVFAHVRGSFVLRQPVPVVAEVPLLVHRVEADEPAVVGDPGPEP